MTGRLTTTSDSPVWTDEARNRLLGACDGYTHAIAWLRIRIGQANYHPINPRHTRLLKQRAKIIAPLKAAEEHFTKALRDCQEVYKRERGRRALAEREDGE